MNRTLQVSLITEEQIPAAGEMLARAFSDDPLCVYTQPDPGARMSQFAWLFTQLIREGARQNGVYVGTFDHQPHGVAVWTPPQAAAPTAPGAAGNGMGQLARRLGPEEYRRFTTAYRHFGRIRQRMAGPNWYLRLLGVSPGFQGQGVGCTLLSPVLKKADHEGLPCYLETFVPQNVPFYEHRGFRVVAGGLDRRSLVPFWAMRRPPRGLSSSGSTAAAESR
jgi:GNAT superfamily N-acetyltransferase